MRLPSKKVLSVLILTTALTASVIIVFGKSKDSSAANLGANIKPGEKIVLSENPDWENELNKLNEKFSFPTSTSNSLSDETTTDTLSTSLISNYLALKQGGLVNEDSIQKLLDSSEAYIGEPSTKKITAAEIKVIYGKTPELISAYGENLGTVLKNTKPKEIKNELEILKEALDNENPKKLEELQEIIDTYHKIAEETKKIPVPQPFIKAHIDIVNGALGLAEGLLKIKIVFTDPIQGLQGIQLYQNSGDLFVTALGASTEFIRLNNISYKQGSGGYYLLYGI